MKNKDRLLIGHVDLFFFSRIERIITYKFSDDTLPTTTLTSTHPVACMPRRDPPRPFPRKDFSRITNITFPPNLLFLCRRWTIFLPSHSTLSRADSIAYS